MKKIVTLLVLITFAATFSSCKKDDESPSKVFSATVDDEDFKADEIEGYIDGDMLEVYAEDKDGNSFFGYMNSDDFEEGETYDFEDDFDELDAEIYYVTEDEEYFYPTSGKLKITKLTESRIEATFEFTAEDFSSGDEIEIEDGVIKMSLEKD
jgi:hypothetical protein